MVDHYQISRSYSSLNTDMDSNESYQLIVYNRSETSFTEEQLSLTKHSNT